MKRNPAPDSKRELYQFYVNLTKAVSQLDKLCKVPELNLEQEGSVEGSVRLIRQLISTKVDKSFDVGLIKKCNREDIS